MGFHPVSAGIEVALRATQHGQELVNTFGFLAATPTPSDADILSALDKVQNTFLPLYRLLLTNECSFYKVVATDLSSVGGHQFENALSVIGGVAGTQPLPLSVAGVVAFKPTSVRGRGSRGRNFVFGLTEADTASDSWVTRGDFELAYQSLIGPFAPIPGTPVFAVLSRKHGIAHIVGEVIARAGISIQKDRLPNHKRRRHHA